MAILDETGAWRILHAFTRDCMLRDPGSLRAVYAVGPLAGGYYQAGSCDLQLVLIAADSSRPTWGRCFAPGPALEVLNERYRRTYHLSEESGASALLESELTPPYRNVQAVPLIARLKYEGRLLWGSDNLAELAMPTAKDERRAARQYERWWAQAYPGDEEVFQLDLPACVGAIREHIFRYLWIENDEIVFQPVRQLQRFQVTNPPGLDITAVRLVERYLAGHDLSDFELDLLRGWLVELRAVMNAHLNLSPHS
jgi:hypothetical protein